jgi:hypothetical protein
MFISETATELTIYPHCPANDRSLLLQNRATNGDYSAIDPFRAFGTVLECLCSQW